MNRIIRYLSFNTSHVTLYRAKEWAMEHLECEFQYISCYSLSDSAYIRYLVVLCFNTSHVTLYRGMASTNGMERYVSIHLMLLFIYILPRNHLRMSVFQYISCYSLSLPIRHVKDFDMEFQYISCYSLSKCRFIFVIECRTFQYISCYSLSCQMKK